MGLRWLVARLAAGAPARVFVVCGSGGRARLDRLRLDPRVDLVGSPRAASILLVVGALPEGLRAPARALHDMLPAPRATVWWNSVSDSSAFPGALVLGDGSDPGEMLWRTQAALFRGELTSEPDLGSDIDPAPWRGVGPYGQGGRGMTGGVPYGRPLAERAPDRDGLELDQLAVRIGPFFPPFPPGLMLELGLQGDVIQTATLGENAFAGGEVPRLAPASDADPFVRALSEPVPVAELELARARHHLLWLAGALDVHGLDALGRRVRRLAVEPTPASVTAVRDLRRLLERTRSLGWATAGVGVTGPTLLERVPPGPVARAAGIAEDARRDDFAYLALGFRPVVERAGDARARWRQRLNEAVQSLLLAGRAGASLRAAVGRVESPCGTLTAEASPAQALIELVPSLVAGMEWGDAVTTIVSLDLDPEAAARPLVHVA